MQKCEREKSIQQYAKVSKKYAKYTKVCKSV